MILRCSCKVFDGNHNISSYCRKNTGFSLKFLISRTQLSHSQQSRGHLKVSKAQYLNSILKSRDITLPTKVCLVKAMVFPVVMYGCESWTIKKAECQKTDVFGLQFWRRLLRVPWTIRRSNQSILKEISPEYSLERLMLKLKLQYLAT